MISLKWTKTKNSGWLEAILCPNFPLKQQGFTYSAFGPFNKHNEGIQEFGETCNLNQIYKNRLHDACFTYDVAYSDSKNFAKRLISD